MALIRVSVRASGLFWQIFVDGDFAAEDLGCGDSLVGVIEDVADVGVVDLGGEASRGFAARGNDEIGAASSIISQLDCSLSGGVL